MMYDTEFELCTVVCECCGTRYDTVEYADEIPVLCDHCHTPSLRVIDWEPTEFRPLYEVEYGTYEVADSR